MTGYSTGFPMRDLERFGPGSSENVTPEFARKYTASLAGKHYENFTVVTFFLPKALRQPFYNLYAYCRWADDLADEAGHATHLLDWWETELDAMYAGRATHPVFVALAETVREYAIPREPFADLLWAFRQDQQTLEYTSREQLLEYCRHSANPVGRLILYLARTTDAESFRLSDAICTGLQLANFWQDVARDWHERRRIYLPDDDRQRFGATREIWEKGQTTPEFAALLQEETDWAETFFQTGRPLISRVPKAFRLEIRLFHDGGMAVLSAVRRQNYDVWTRRPVVTKFQKLRLLLKTFFN
ncbi:MAG: squalene synthase HpnC [Planctomycetia bacterium]|nr:squalene synthase HpnC [Planctomycetia bacterium]